jgi:chaperonin GroEL
MGAKLLNAVAQKAADAAGDGTTTATILAAAIFQQGLRLVEAGADPMSLKRGIDKGVQAAVAKLSTIKRKVSSKAEIAAVATIAANNDPVIGAILADAFEKVGKDGAITIEDGRGMETTLEVKEGMTFDRGYASPAFVTDPGNHLAVLEDCCVLIHEGPITEVRDLIAFMAKIAATGKPLLIIAEDFGPHPMAAMVMNHLKGKIKVCAVKAPGFGSRRLALLQDIAIFTGGTALTADLGMTLAGSWGEPMGIASTVRVESGTTTIIGGNGRQADVLAHCNMLRYKRQQAHAEYEKEKITERLAKLTGGVAIIHVGAATEAEMRQTKARVEDALHATRSAVAGGIVAGGGSALLSCADHVKEVAALLVGDEHAGAWIVAGALETPLRTIAVNGGQEGAVVVDDVLIMQADHQGCENAGYDANNPEFIEQDMFVAGIIDPFQVTVAALEAAASVAGLLLTTDVAITQDRG